MAVSSNIRIASLMVSFVLAVVASWSMLAAEKGTPPPRTELEASLSKTGRILVKEFHPLGKIDGTVGTSLEMDTLVLYEPAMKLNGEKACELKSKRRVGSSDRTLPSWTWMRWRACRKALNI
jgi:hypothetical protein